MSKNILDIKNLRINYELESSVVQAINNVSITMKEGEILGLVGETGAGKTTFAKGIMGIVPDPPGRIVEGKVIFNGKDLLKANKREMKNIRGNKISMIFQDPMTSLNPVYTVGQQIAEVISLHKTISKKEAIEKAQDMLATVGIPRERYNEYPHQFSGGMKQRVVIAMALACSPELLIADEPTTALDVTIQMQVLQLMKHLRNELGTSLILITHDFGVVAEMCEKVAIMYAGEIIEHGTVEDVFENGLHPYTKGLFDSLPSMSSRRNKLKPIPGLMPDPTRLKDECKFSTRCPHVTEACTMKIPNLTNVSETQKVRCVLFHS